MRRKKKFGGITVAGVRQKERKAGARSCWCSRPSLGPSSAFFLAVAVDLVFGLSVAVVGFASLIALTGLGYSELGLGGQIESSWRGGHSGTLAQMSALGLGVR